MKERRCGNGINLITARWKTHPEAELWKHIQYSLLHIMFELRNRSITLKQGNSHIG